MSDRTFWNRKRGQTKTTQQHEQGLSRYDLVRKGIPIPILNQAASGGGAGSVNTLALSFPGNTLLNSVIIAIAAYAANTATTITGRTCTDNNANTYTTDAFQESGSIFEGIDCFSCTNQAAKAAPHTITITIPNSASAGGAFFMAIFEFLKGTLIRNQVTSTPFSGSGIPSTFSLFDLHQGFSVLGYAAFNDHISWSDNPTLIGTDASVSAGLSGNNSNPFPGGGASWSESVLGSNPTLGLQVNYP